MLQVARRFDPRFFWGGVDGDMGMEIGRVDGGSERWRLNDLFNMIQ